MGRTNLMAALMCGSVLLIVVILSEMRDDHPAEERTPARESDSVAEATFESAPVAEPVFREEAGREVSGAEGMRSPEKVVPALIVEVRDAVSGAPIIGCTVSLRQRQPSVSSLDPAADWSQAYLMEVAAGQTGDDGIYSLSSVSNGRYEVLLVSDEVTVEPLEVSLSGQTVRSLLLATRLASVTGLCVDAGSRPVSGARVMLVRERESDLTETKYSAHTGSDGRFLLKGIPVETGSRYSVASEHDLYLDRPTRAVTLQQGVPLDCGTLVFHDQRTAVGGTLILATGEPAIGLEIVLQRRSGWRTDTGYCDQNGRFEMLGNGPGEYTLSVEPYCIEGSASYGLAIVEGSANLELGTLEAREGQMELRGSVVDETGMPIVGARVSVGGLAMRSGEGGAFALRVCGIGSYRITARWSPPGERFEISTHADIDAATIQSPVALRLVRRGVLFRLVDRSTGEEVSGSTAEIRALSARSSWSRSFPFPTGGLMRLQHLEPGDWQFEIRVKGYQVWSRTERIGTDIQEAQRRIDVLLEKE